MRPLVKTVLFIVVFGALLTAGFAGIMRASLPDLEKNHQLVGLSAPVSVQYDRYAIPTIKASSARDAYQTLGFLHAQNRLWQMIISRRVAQGRMSEILGGAALDLDRFMRVLGLHRSAQDNLADLAPATLDALQAYSDGVNQYIAQQWILAPEFWLFWHSPEPWEPADSVAFTKLMALDLAGNWRQELRRARIEADLGADILPILWPPAPAGTPTTIGPHGDQVSAYWGSIDRTVGSNAWAVKAALGGGVGPILANDPHLAMRAPSIWYLARFETPEFEFTGATIAGMPVPVLGRNRHLAWGMTNTGSDQQDLVILTAVDEAGVADPNGGFYRTAAGLKPFARREETIPVRFGADENISIRHSIFGPVISDGFANPVDFLAENQSLALQWTALLAGDVSIQAGFSVAKAQNADDLVQAFRDFKAPQQNVTYATQSGDIGFIAAGWAPVRVPGSGWLPVDAREPLALWQEMIPYEALPQIRNPAANYLFNANNAPIDDGYKFDLGRDFDAGMRARRLQSLFDGLVTSDANATPRDGIAAAQSMQTDIYSTLAAETLPILLPMIADQPELLEIHRLLAGWDHVASTGSVEMTIFAAWYDRLAARIYADELGEHFLGYRGIRSSFMRLVLTDHQVWCDDRRTLGRETCATQATKALNTALQDLPHWFGGGIDTWRWGKIHRFNPAHAPASNLPVIGQLFATGLPLGGDGSSVNVAHYRRTSEGYFDVWQGPGYRGIYALARSDHAMMVVAGGQSGHPWSPHYQDLAKLWQANAYVEISDEDGIAASFMP